MSDRIDFRAARDGLRRKTRQQCKTKVHNRRIVPYPFSNFAIRNVPKPSKILTPEVTQFSSVARNTDRCATRTQKKTPRNDDQGHPEASVWSPRAALAISQKRVLSESACTRPAVRMSVMRMAPLMMFSPVSLSVIVTSYRWPHPPFPTKTTRKLHAPVTA